MDDAAKSYVPPPKTLPGFPKAKKAKRKTPTGNGKKRSRWINDDGDILEWDYQHGRIERYSPRGKHRGEFDPYTGKQTKPAKPGRTIMPTIVKAKRSQKICFELLCWGKTSDDLVSEVPLEGVTEDDVRKAFGLAADEYPGDSLDVSAKHIKWLKTKTDVSIDLDKFEYSVDIFSE